MCTQEANNILVSVYLSDGRYDFLTGHNNSSLKFVLSYTKFILVVPLKLSIYKCFINRMQGNITTQM
jgi:hypothetical protein